MGNEEVKKDIDLAYSVVEDNGSVVIICRHDRLIFDYIKGRLSTKNDH